MVDITGLFHWRFQPHIAPSLPLISPRKAKDVPRPWTLMRWPMVPQFVALAAAQGARSSLWQSWSCKKQCCGEWWRPFLSIYIYIYIVGIEREREGELFLEILDEASRGDSGLPPSGWHLQDFQLQQNGNFEWVQLENLEYLQKMGIETYNFPKKIDSLQFIPWFDCGIFQNKIVNGDSISI